MSKELEIAADALSRSHMLTDLIELCLVREASDPLDSTS